MIYLDTSVALASLFAEDRRLPASLWDHPLVSSRLLEYELWNRIHARNLTRSHGDAAQGLVGRLALLELSPPVLAREPSMGSRFRCERSTPCIWHRSTICVVGAKPSSWPATTAE